MIFNSLTFIVFFAIVLFLHHLPLSWRVKKFNLLVASYIFYGAWNPPFVLILWLSTVVDWFVAKAIYAQKTQRGKFLMLLVSLVVNLGMLGFFKYGGFVLENFVLLVNSLGIAYSPALPSIILPVGISFYTFQTLSYTLDVYRGELKPGKSFLDFAFFVTFFPQLVAGPIVRASEFLPQCEAPRPANRDQFVWGFCLLTLGLFQKVVLADTLLAHSSETVFDAKEGLAVVDAWVGLLAFSSQIFCDFAGYSTCAIGVGLSLGFAFPNNFRSPYAACGFADFWQRWHMTLSRFLRDYLYIPLGGNRHGVARTYLNLMITMVLGGLWHGASWTFVLWGAVHGLLLIIERVAKAAFGHMAFWRTLPSQLFLTGMTYVCILLTWVLFRAQTFPNASRMFASLFGLVKEPIMVLATLDIAKVLIVTVGLLVAHWLLKNSSQEKLVAKTPWWVLVTVWVFMAFAIILAQGGGDAFIYFQF